MNRESLFDRDDKALLAFLKTVNIERLEAAINGDHGALWTAFVWATSEEHDAENFPISGRLHYWLHIR